VTHAVLSLVLLLTLLAGLQQVLSQVANDALSTFAITADVLIAE